MTTETLSAGRRQALRPFQEGILRWFRGHRRRLPWRTTRNPYRILVSEIMLQQTQVDRVRPKYEAFLRRWPTLRSLARARRSSVIRMWSGLGYNNRAVRLHSLARAVVRRFGGHLPRSRPELEALPGIGRYTARAVATFAFGEDIAAVDTNYDRVVRRFFFGLRSIRDRSLLALADAVVPDGKGSQWNQAMMDFGAMVCRSRPRCEICPLQSSCRAYPTVLKYRTPKRVSHERFFGSNRFYRGKIVDALREHRSSTGLTLSHLLVLVGMDGLLDAVRFHTLLLALEHDGVLALRGSGTKQRVALR